MKHLFTLIIASFSYAVMVGQNYADLVVFSDDGKKFYLDVNGARQNNSASTNVKVSDLIHEYVKLRIQFEDATYGEVSQGVMISPGEETVYMVKLAKSGKYKLGFVSNAPRGGNSSSGSEQSTVIYNPAGVSPTSGQQTATGSTTTTTTTTTTTGSSAGETVKMGIQTGGETIGISMNLPAMSGAEVSETTTTTSTTTTSSSASSTATSRGQGNAASARVEGNRIILSDGRSLSWKYTKLHAMTGVEIEMKEPLNAMVSVSYDGKEAFNSDVPFMYVEKDWKRNNSYFKLEVKESDGTSWSVKLKHSSNYRILIDDLQGGNGSSATAVSSPPPAASASASDACRGPISSASFESAKNSIKSKPFEDSKMTVAKQIINANCFTASQVKDFMGLFTYEESKLEIAKFCYKKTVDRGNYYQVNDAFTYSSSIDDLNEYIQGSGE
jgi:hypothetical protein